MLRAFCALLSVVLGATALVGDWLVSINHRATQRALTDSATHGLIGLVTWLIIVLSTKHYETVVQLWEVCVCGFISSAIDVDHFIAAKSLKLKDAMQLSSRPFLHCTSIPLATCALFIIFTYELKYLTVHKYSWLLFAAFASHHIRDGTRRGLWMWPFGSTPPLPYFLYIGSTIALPHLLAFVMKHSYIRPHVQTIQV